jgi:MoaA/NifB/PqqE/SkfB family radical SAM enzyme
MAIKKEDEDYILDGTKIEWYPDRVSKWLEGKRIAPVTIDMALTQACNFQCVYCYAKLQKQNEKFKITKEVITSFLDDCKEIGVKGVSLVSDGESSISPVFEHAITYGYDRGIAMAVGTNGYLCTTPVLEKIMPCLTYIRFNASAGEEGRYAEIMGVDKSTFRTVKRNIKEAVRIRKQGNLCVSIGIQMVFMPQFVDQVIPLAELAIDLGVDYLQIKHCSDNESGELGVDYGAYGSCFNVLKKAESMSTSDTLIKVKWSKIIDGNVRSYKRCYGPPFHLQISGTGLVAPCFAPETTFITKDGLKQIQHIKDGEYIYTPNGYSKCKVWKKNEKREVVEVGLSNGMKIEVTKDHKLFVGQKWTNACETKGLRASILPVKTDWIGNDYYGNEEDYLRLGFLLGDGFKHEAKNDYYVCIGKKDKDIEYLFKECNKSSLSRPDRRYIPNYSRISFLINDFQLRLDKVWNRSVPDKVYTLSPNRMCSFLKGIFSANGCCEKNRKRISLKTTSPLQVINIQILLLALGIRSRINSNKPTIIKWPNGIYKSRRSYSLSITDFESIKVFREKIGFIQIYKTIILESYSVSKKLPKIKDPTVISIRDWTRYGPIDVYDFSVENECHSAWANGFIAHNCGMLFNDKYKRYHIGNITKERFLDIWKSEKYWNVMEELSSNSFNAQTMCGTLCLQHSTNKYLDKIVNHKPDHIEFF